MVSNFLFHRVNPKREKLWDPMDVGLFDKCIRHITTHFNTILAEEFFLTQNILSDEKYATVMFDDGYKDNLEYAAPILEKYGCKASFYVVTDCIERNIPTWTHLLDYRFESTQRKALDLDFDFIPDRFKTKSLPTLADRLLHVSELKPFLKKISHEQRTLVLDRVAETFNDVAIPVLMMNWNDLRQLKSAGHYIGSHTVHHSMLGTMNNESEIVTELRDSGESIERNLGHFPITISYPVGSYNGVTENLSAAAGYKLGLAVNQKLYDPTRDSKFAIPRVELYNESWWKTKMRISHTLEHIKAMLKYN